jgi:hypothetical protein
MPGATSFQLPIDDVLPRILAAAGDTTRLVIAAPPGAGKTTRVPLALRGQDWLRGGRGWWDCSSCVAMGPTVRSLPRGAR